MRECVQWHGSNQQKRVNEREKEGEERVRQKQKCDGVRDKYGEFTKITATFPFVTAVQ